ncbi:hypothetical protein M5K25_021037 [Dendrobium thyrsiflorum]|uniref:Uncharacterized protein n=1 Tax=Dendrobium thyrsiflorum TaxID=117978 RepID=A0ABD0UBL9_DENTH
MKRNKITPQRAEDLVYVDTNLHFLSRKTPLYMTELLEVANLSLDEPELEAMIFNDDDIEGQRPTSESNSIILSIECTTLTLSILDIFHLLVAQLLLSGYDDLWLLHANEYEGDFPKRDELAYIYMDKTLIAMHGELTLTLPKTPSVSASGVALSDNAIMWSL